VKRDIKTFVLGVVVTLLGSACSNVKEIPAGFVGRVLTPTGWENDIREAGQVDLGQSNANGTYNTLVLLEATSTLVKEQFMAPDAVGNEDKQDHRVLTRKGTPLAVDVYIRAVIPGGNPDADKQRNNVFALVTPRDGKGDALVRYITVEDVYNRFARMDVRSKVRAIFAGYDDYQAVYSDYQAVNDKISAMVTETFVANGVPLDLQNVSLSNVKPDETLWAAQNQSASALAKVSAINQIGAALRANPEYVTFMKWESLERIAETGSKSGTNTLIITGESGSLGDSLAAAEYLRGQIKPVPQDQQPEKQ